MRFPGVEQHMGFRMNDLPPEIIENIATNLTSRLDLIAFGNASHKMQRIADRIMPFTCNERGPEKLMAAVNTIRLSKATTNRLVPRLIRLVIGVKPSPNPHGSGAPTQVLTPEGVEYTSCLMLDLIQHASRAEDIQITSFGAPAAWLVQTLSGCKRLKRLAFQPTTESDAAAQRSVRSRLTISDLKALVRETPSLTHLHIREVIPDPSSTSISVALDTGVIGASLLLLDLNRPLFGDVDLLDLVNGHLTSLQEFTVVFHERLNILTVEGVRAAVRACAGTLRSLHLGFNSGTRIHMRHVLTGDIPFPRLQRLVTCSTIVPDLYTVIAHIPTLQVIRTNAMAPIWIDALERMDKDNVIPGMMQTIGIIHKSAVRSEIERVQAVCGRNGVQVQWWEAKMGPPPMN